VRGCGGEFETVKCWLENMYFVSGKSLEVVQGFVCKVGVLK